MISRTWLPVSWDSKGGSLPIRSALTAPEVIPGNEPQRGTRPAATSSTKTSTGTTPFPINYIAYDRMSGSDRFRNEYNGEEVAHFDAYLQRQVDKIDIPNKDSDFLRDKIIEMYGNTVKNHLEHRGKKE